MRLRNALRIGAVAASTATAAVLFGAPAATAAGTDVKISPQSAPGTEITKAIASATFSSAVLRDDGPFTNQTWTAHVVKTCDGTVSQQWVRDFSVNATFLPLQNRNSGLLATAEGTRIVQRVEISSLSQRWSVLGA